MFNLSGPPLTTTRALFTEATWVEISQSVADAFRMTADERDRLETTGTARLIAAIPFLAGCDDAARTAVAHVGTYLLSVSAADDFSGPPSNDGASLIERLRLISNFKGGDKTLIDRGMDLLALNVISRLSPVSEGSPPGGDFDRETAIAELRERIDAVPCPDMDALLTDARQEAWWR